jgi:hypothetical protein
VLSGSPVLLAELDRVASGTFVGPETDGGTTNAVLRVGLVDLFLAVFFAGTFFAAFLVPFFVDRVTAFFFVACAALFLVAPPFVAFAAFLPDFFAAREDERDFVAIPFFLVALLLLLRTPFTFLLLFFAAI